MKCYIVQDLLPEYIEGLCSAETEKEIEEHLADCEHCKKKMEEMQETEGKSAAGFDEIQPFKKIGRELKKNRIKKVIAIMLLVIVCGVFGVLTIGQIFPSLSCPSYDSLMYRYKAKQIAQKLVDGEIKEVLKSTGTSYDVRNSTGEGHDIFFYDVADRISQSYEKTFKGKEVTIDVEGVTYSDNTDGYWTPDTNIQYPVYGVDLRLEVEDKLVSVQIIFKDRYNYDIHISNGKENYEYFEEEYVNSFEYYIQDMSCYLYYYKDSCMGYNVANDITSGRINIQNSETAEEIGKDGFSDGFYSFYFVRDCTGMPIVDKETKVSEYAAQIGNGLYEVLSRCKSNDFQLTDGGYNEGEKKYDAVLYWRVTDLQGKQCIMTKNFYYGPFGYEPVDDKEIICPEAGFDREVTSELERIFD